MENGSCFVIGSRNPACQLPYVEPRDSFEIVMRKKYKEYSNIPCYVRRQINEEAGATIAVNTPNDGMHFFELQRGKNKTRIGGPDYNEFLKHYDIKHYDTMRFQNLLGGGLNIYSISAINIDGVQKPRIQDQDSLQDALAVVFSRAVERSSIVIASTNHCIGHRGIGLSGVFVHRLTDSDVENNCLHIPKDIVSGLRMPRSGNAYLVMTEAAAENRNAEYYTSKDGRIRFRSGWPSFAAANALTSGKTVLIMFHKVQHQLYISFDVLAD